MKQNIERFSHINDFTDYLERTPSKNWDDSNRSSRSVGRYDFYKSKSFKECLDYAVKGWPEGLEKVKQKIGLAKSTGRSKMNINCVAGGRPDIGRFLAGMPDCMTRRVIQEGMKRPMIDIVINACYSGGIDGEIIMNYGAAIAVVIDELESNGYSVGLYVGAANDHTNRDESFGALIEVKKAGEIMDMERLVFFAAHPSFLRRFMFGYWETKYEERGFQWGYGKISEIKPENMPEDSIYFGCQDPALNRACHSVETARQFIRNRIFAQRPDMIDMAA